MKTKDFLAKLEERRIVEAIGAAEKRTSAEIRVHIAHRPASDPMAEAVRVFEKLDMTRTHERNGVLIFVAPRSRNFAVIGDRGIHEKCGESFWRTTTEGVAGYFKRDDCLGGILHAIEKAGEELARHFPRRANDRNELPDGVSQG
jgi:uncharacterized membrane protein